MQEQATEKAKQYIQSTNDEMNNEEGIETYYAENVDENIEQATIKNMQVISEEKKSVYVPPLQMTSPAKDDGIQPAPFMLDTHKKTPRLIEHNKTIEADLSTS